MQRRLYARFTLVLLGVLAGCGGGGAGGGTVPSTPAPQPTPAPAPLTLSSTAVALGVSGQQNTFTVTEAGYTGIFRPQLDAACAGIVASVTPDSAYGPSATFTLNPGASSGSCNVTVADSAGQKATLSVSVTQVSGVLQ